MMYEKRLFNFLFLWVVTDHTFIISLHYGSTYTRTKMTIPFDIQSNRLIPSTSVLIQYLSIACITEYEVGAILQSSSRVLEKKICWIWKITWPLIPILIDCRMNIIWTDYIIDSNSEIIHIIFVWNCFRIKYHEILNLHQETWIQKGHISY